MRFELNAGQDSHPACGAMWSFYVPSMVLVALAVIAL